MAIRDPYVAQVHLCSTLVFFFLIHGLIGLFNKRKAATNNIQAFHLIFMVPLSLATGMWLQHVLFADHVELCLVILNTEGILNYIYAYPIFTLRALFHIILSIYVYRSIILYSKSIYIYIYIIYI